jgi:hypothetical protein
MSDLDKALYHARGVGMDDRDIAAAVTRAAEDLVAQQRVAGVTLTHPDLPGQPYVVPPELVEGYANSGWQPAQPDLEPETEEAEPPPLVDVELPEQAEPAEEK